MADKDLENMRDPEQKTMLRFQPKTKIRIRSEKNRILKIRIRKKKDPKDKDPKDEDLKDEDLKDKDPKDEDLKDKDSKSEGCETPSCTKLVLYIHFHFFAIFFCFLIRLYSRNAMGSSHDPVGSDQGGSACVRMIFTAPTWSVVQSYNPRVFSALEDGRSIFESQTKTNENYRWIFASHDPPLSLQSTSAAWAWSETQVIFIVFASKLKPVFLKPVPNNTLMFLFVSGREKPTKAFFVLEIVINSLRNGIGFSFPEKPDGHSQGQNLCFLWNSWKRFLWKKCIMKRNQTKETHRRPKQL